MAVEVNVFTEATRLYEQLKAIPLGKATNETLEHFRNRSSELMRASMATFEENF